MPLEDLGVEVNVAPWLPMNAPMFPKNKVTSH
jgi:hypothetical protein